MTLDADLDPDLDLVLTRDLAAPAALLFECWTKPEHLVHWFVPKPHKVVKCEQDLRPGGACDMTFDVDGTLMENNGVYLEIIPGRKLVFTDGYRAGWKPVAEPFMTAIVTFDDLEDGRCRYRAVVRHRSKESAETHKNMGFHDGWGTVATQLEGYAQEVQGRRIVLSREIKAPPEVVWRCWTDPAILPLWFGPEGFSCQTKEIDLREGGQWRFDMIGPDGTVWANRHRYQVMLPHRQIAFLMDADADDGSAKTVLVELTPTEGGTLLTQTMTFPTLEERDGALGYGADRLGQTTLAKLAAKAEAL